MSGPQAEVLVEVSKKKVRSTRTGFMVGSFHEGRNLEKDQCPQRRIAAQCIREKCNKILTASPHDAEERHLRVYTREITMSAQDLTNRPGSRAG